MRREARRTAQSARRTAQSTIALVGALAALGGLCRMTAAKVPLAPDGDSAGGSSSAPPARERASRRLPGMQPEGSILLPTQWSLRPAGEQIVLGDFPVNIAMHPTEPWAAILHAGYGQHEIVVVDLSAKRIVSRAGLPQSFYGICFDPRGRQLFASGAEDGVVHQFAFSAGFLSDHRELPLGSGAAGSVPAGLCCSPDGKTLYVASPWGDTVSALSVQGSRDPAERRAGAAKGAAGNPPEGTGAPGSGSRAGAPGRPRTPRAAARHVSLKKDSYPFTCLPDRSGKRIFVSLWGGSAVAVLDAATLRVQATWGTDSHPTEMALSPDGGILYVSCANSNVVAVLDTKSGRALEAIGSALHPSAPPGSTPDSLSLSRDGKTLVIANADNNNVAVVDVGTRGRSRPLGFIPAGWYPTSVRFDGRGERIYVANGKGMMPRANRQGPNPLANPPMPVREYIAGLLRGTLEMIGVPSPTDMATLTKQAYACSPLRADAAPVGRVPGAAGPIPVEPGGSSPIRHCLYIIKENRTYDQVLGDVPEGNGDPDLCLFPEKVTPNHHALARQFVLLDNFYVESEVSADGHEWSTAAYATDFVEKSWPLVYRPGGKDKIPYPSKGSLSIALPAGGYIWDRCREAGISYRSYGEFVENGKGPSDPATTGMKALEGHFDPLYRAYDLDVPDVARAARFIEELKRFESEGEMPRFIVMHLPNDHTYGSRAGKPTPTAYVADNDLALGRVVEAVSRSRFWKDTAIFVVEDDAQNGSDHVDAHRTVALVISPYVRRGFVDSSMYSTASMLRTIELILGLRPMSQYDAAALPMYASFQSTADLTPYAAREPGVARDTRNAASAWGSRLSERLDFRTADAADDLLLNEIVWRSVRGADAPMPPPIRASFVRPLPDGDGDHDD